MGQAFVGFYWTLPVPHRGYRTLPDDVEAAAKRSRTIRYQLDVIRRYVRAEKGHLIKEFAFIELASDRGTDAVAATLEQVAALCTTHDARLVYVDFSDHHAWRPHTFMRCYLEEHAVPREHPLPSDPVMMDGRKFDPAKHFSAWRQRHGEETRALRERAEAEIVATVDRLPEGSGRHAAAAADLNRRGIRTTRGGSWTAEGVRKAYKRSQQPAG